MAHVASKMVISPLENNGQKLLFQEIFLVGQMKKVGKLVININLRVTADASTRGVGRLAKRVVRLEQIDQNRSRILKDCGELFILVTTLEEIALETRDCLIRSLKDTISLSSQYAAQLTPIIRCLREVPQPPRE